MKLQLPISSDNPNVSRQPDESVQDVLEEVRRMRNEEDERVERWLNRADQYLGRMRE